MPDIYSQARRALECWQTGKNAKLEASKNAAAFSDDNCGLNSGYGLWSRQILIGIRAMDTDDWEAVIDSAEETRRLEFRKAKKYPTGGGRKGTAPPPREELPWPI